MRIVENLSHPLISALSWSVLHSLWQFAIIMALFFIAMKLTGRSRAGIRHHLAFMSLLAMPIAFIITFIRQYRVYSQARMIVSFEFDGISVAAGPGGSNFFLIERDIPGLLERFEAYTPWIFWIYLAGLVYFSVQSVVGYYRVNNMRKSSLQVVPAGWMQPIHVLANKAGVPGMHAYLSQKVDIPLVAGIVKPVVLLPASIFTSLTPEQIETIILHEFRHIRNGDHYLNIIQNLIEIFFFYHPATWFISKHLRIEREKRIDEWVVGESRAPLPYAQALMQLESNRGQTMQPVLAATQSNNHLLTRIKNIMTMKTRRFNPGKNMAAIITIVSAALAIAWFDPAHGVNYYYGANDTYDHFQLDLPDPDPLAGVALLSPEEARRQEAYSLTSKEPRRVNFHDGSSMTWETLSEEDRREISKAIEEARIALAEVNRDMIEKFRSEEFRLQMQQVQEEIRKAMEEINIETSPAFQSEEFREEMRKAMEEVRHAMEEMNKELNNQFHSDEFREEMRKAGKEVRKALEELEKVDWEALGEEINRVMSEAGRVVEEIGPKVNETIKELKLDELLREVMEIIEKATSETEDEGLSREGKEEKPGN